MTVSSLILPRPHRALGYKRDQYDPRDLTTTELAVRVGAVRPRKALARPDMRFLRTKRKLQGNAGACFAFASSRAVHKSLLLQTPSLDFSKPLPQIEAPSEWMIYVNGRLQEFAGKDPRGVILHDTGTYPRLGMKGIQAVGYCPESAAPYLDTRVNTRPPDSAYKAAVDQSGFAYARISEKGPAFIDKVANLLMAGQPVIIGMQVDNAFMDNRNAIVTAIDPQHIAGGHMLDVAAVEDYGGQKCVWLDNWWPDHGIDLGPNFEDGGWSALSLDLAGSGWITDAYTIIAAPIWG